jgi:Rod binding domain-containing protein
MIGGISNSLLPGGTARPVDCPKGIQEAAAQFEALLLANLMKDVRESAQSGWAGGEDESGTAVYEMAEQQFAQALAMNGGMGLARIAMAGIKPAA